MSDLIFDNSNMLNARIFDHGLNTIPSEDDNAQHIPVWRTYSLNDFLQNHST